LQSSQVKKMKMVKRKEFNIPTQNNIGGRNISGKYLLLWLHVFTYPSLYDRLLKTYNYYT